MSDDVPAEGRCLFCRMKTRVRVFRAPLCGICLEQSDDFIWVSLVQILFLLAGVIDGFFFVVEEILLFFVLIVVKHRIPSLLARITVSR